MGLALGSSGLSVNLEAAKAQPRKARSFFRLLLLLFFLPLPAYGAWSPMIVVIVLRIVS